MPGIVCAVDEVIYRTEIRVRCRRRRVGAAGFGSTAIMNGKPLATPALSQLGHIGSKGPGSVGAAPKYFGDR